MRRTARLHELNLAPEVTRRMEPEHFVVILERWRARQLELSPVLGGVERGEHPTGTRPPPSGVLISGLSSPRLRPLLCFGLEFPVFSNSLNRR